VQERLQRSKDEGRSALDHMLPRGGGMIKGDGNDGVIRMEGLESPPCVPQGWATLELNPPRPKSRPTGQVDRPLLLGPGPRESCEEFPGLSGLFAGRCHDGALLEECLCNPLVTPRRVFSSSEEREAGT
jgi:hypothetical protein